MSNLHHSEIKRNHAETRKLLMEAKHMRIEAIKKEIEIDNTKFYKWVKKWGIIVAVIVPLGVAGFKYYVDLEKAKIAACIKNDSLKWCK